MIVFLCGDYKFLCQMFGLSGACLVGISVLRLCTNSSRSTLLPMVPHNPGTTKAVVLSPGLQQKGNIY